MFFLVLVVSTSAVEKFVFRVTYYESSRTLNSTHSLINSDVKALALNPHYVALSLEVCGLDHGHFIYGLSFGLSRYFVEGMLSSYLSYAWYSYLLEHGLCFAFLLLLILWNGEWTYITVHGLVLVTPSIGLAISDIGLEADCFVNITGVSLMMLFVLCRRKSRSRSRSDSRYFAQN